MVKKYFLNLVLFLVIISLFVSSCALVENNSTELPVEQIEETVTEEIVEEIILEEVVEIVEEDLVVSCLVSADCEWNEYCIGGFCGMTSDIYNTDGDCDSKCNFNNVQVSTSDGDELILSRGQGSYTAAGAVEWKLLSSADYCLGEGATPVAVELIMKNLGQILSKKVIVLNVGDESNSITHPSITSIDFRLVVESYDETCG